MTLTGTQPGQRPPEAIRPQETPRANVSDYFMLRAELAREEHNLREREAQTGQPVPAETRAIAAELQGDLDEAHRDVLQELQPKLARGERLSKDEQHFLAIDLIQRGEQSAYADLIYRQHTGSASKAELVKKLPWWKSWLKKTGVSAAAATVISVATGGVAVPMALGASAAGSLGRLIVDYIHNKKDFKLRQELAQNIQAIITEAKTLAEQYEANPTEANRIDSIKKLFEAELAASDPEPAVMRTHKAAIESKKEELAKYRTKMKRVSAGVAMVFAVFGGAALGAAFPEYNATEVLARAKAEGFSVDLDQQSLPIDTEHLVKQTTDGVIRWKMSLAELQVEVKEAMHLYGEHWQESMHLYGADGKLVPIDPEHLDPLTDDQLYRSFTPDKLAAAEAALTTHANQVLDQARELVYHRAATALSGVLAAQFVSDIPGLLARDKLGSASSSGSTLAQTAEQQPAPEQPATLGEPIAAQPDVEIEQQPELGRTQREIIKESLWGGPGEEPRDHLLRRHIGRLQALNKPYLWLDDSAQRGLKGSYETITQMEQPQITDWQYDPAHKADASALVGDALHPDRRAVRIPLAKLLPFVQEVFGVAVGQLWQNRRVSNLLRPTDLVAVVWTDQKSVVYYQYDARQQQVTGQQITVSLAEFVKKFRIHNLGEVMEGGPVPQPEELPAPRFEPPAPPAGGPPSARPELVTLPAETIIDRTRRTGDATIDRWTEADQVKIDLLTADEQRQVLGQTEIHALPYRGKNLSLDDLRSRGLEPKYALQLANHIQACFSSVYELGHSGRLAVVAYIERAPGQFVARSYYLSNSHGVWRYLPYYTTDVTGEIDWYGKGVSQESITAPAGMLAALAKLSENPAATATVDRPDFVFAGTARPVPVPQPGITYTKEVAARPVLLQGNFYPSAEQTRRHEKLAPEMLTFTEADQAPDFSKMVTTFKQRSAVSGEIAMEVIPSKDGKLQYIFCRDPQNYVWIGQIENLSEIQSVGLRKEWVDGGDLVTTRWQYRVEAGTYGDANHPTHPHYVDMFPKYLSKVPVIRDYYRERHVSPPAGFEDMI